MTLAVLKSRTTYVRLATLFIILSTYKLIIVLWSQTVFEHSLSSLYIIPEDFSLRAEKGSNYTEALLAAGKDYFNFTYPPLDSNPHFTIPPKIHFIFFPDLYAVRPSGPVIAHAGSDAPSICIDRNPNFTIKIWDTNEARRLLEDHYAWFLPVYDGYRHPIQRVDAIKYFILWHYGGIYLDLDISCRKGLQPLLDFPAWMPRASPLGVNNDAMAARAGHPLMWRMIESLRRRDRNLVSSWLTIFWTTGPKFVSDMLREYLVGHDFEPIYDLKNRGLRLFRLDTDPNAVYILPREFYSEEYTFFGHSQGGTWHGKDVEAVLWLVERRWVVLGVSVLLAGLGLYVCCVGPFLVNRRRRLRGCLAIAQQDKDGDGDEDMEIELREV